MARSFALLETLAALHQPEHPSNLKQLDPPSELYALALVHKLDAMPVLLAGKSFQRRIHQMAVTRYLALPSLRDIRYPGLGSKFLRRRPSADQHLQHPGDLSSPEFAILEQQSHVTSCP